MDRSYALRSFGAAQVALLVPLLILERRMQRTGGPGIIPFELAGTPERSRRILETWGTDGRTAAKASLVLDYPFLVSYSGFNIALAGLAGERLPGATAIAAAQVAAGACDAAENTALLGVLATSPDGRLPAVAATFARVKFALLSTVWAYLAAGLAAHLARR